MTFVCCNQKSLLLACTLLQLHICASLLLYAPPQKYSMPISRKELISELQGLSKKVAEMRSKWYNKAQLEAIPLPPSHQTPIPVESLLPSDSNSIASLKLAVEVPEDKQQRRQPLVHRPTPAEVSFGIFNAYKANLLSHAAFPEMAKTHDQIHPNSKPLASSNLKVNEYQLEQPEGAEQEEPTIHEYNDDFELSQGIGAQPSNIRDCLFLRSGCMPTRRLDRAYLDKLQALMTVGH